MAASSDEDGAAIAVFGERVETARRYAELLGTSAVERGLIGPREVPRLWSRHILNSAVVVELVSPGLRVIDVGSGAGLPGIAMAIARPDLEVTLVEPLLRRVTWLQEVVSELELSSVRVLRGRAEELTGRVEADVVTARAVAPLGVLAGWCLPLLRAGGLLLAVKGRNAPEEVSAASDALHRLGATRWSVRHCGEAVLTEATTVVEVVAGTRRPRVVHRPRPRR